MGYDTSGQDVEFKISQDFLLSKKLREWKASCLGIFTTSENWTRTAAFLRKLNSLLQLFNQREKFVETSLALNLADSLRKRGNWFAKFFNLRASSLGPNYAATLETKPDSITSSVTFNYSRQWKFSLRQWTLFQKIDILSSKTSESFFLSLFIKKFFISFFLLENCKVAENCIVKLQPAQRDEWIAISARTKSFMKRVAFAAKTRPFCSSINIFLPTPIISEVCFTERN